MKIRNPVYDLFAFFTDSIEICTPAGLYVAGFEHSGDGNDKRLEITFSASELIDFTDNIAKFTVLSEKISISEQIEEEACRYVYQLEMLNKGDVEDQRLLIGYVYDKGIIEHEFEPTPMERFFVFDQARNLFNALETVLRTQLPHANMGQGVNFSMESMYGNPNNGAMVIEDPTPQMREAVIYNAVQKDLHHTISQIFGVHVPLSAYFGLNGVGDQQHSILEWLIRFNSPKSFKQLLVSLHYPTSLFLQASSPLMRLCMPGYERFYAAFAELDAEAKYDHINQSYILLQEERKGYPLESELYQLVNYQLRYLKLLYQVEIAFHSDDQLSGKRQALLNRYFEIEITTDIRDALYESNAYLLEKCIYLERLLTFLNRSQAVNYTLLDKVMEITPEDMQHLASIASNEKVAYLIANLNAKSKILAASCSQEESLTPTASPIDMLTIFKEDRNVEFETRVSTFKTMGAFTIPGYPNTWSLLEWAIFFGSIRIFRTGITHGFSIEPSANNSPFLLLFRAGYDHFFTVVKYHQNTKDSFISFSHTIKQLIGNEMQKLASTDPQTKYYKLYISLIDNLVNAQQLLQKKLASTTTYEYIVNKMLELSILRTKNDSLRVLSTDYDLLNAQALFAISVVNVYTLLPPDQLQNLLMQGSDTNKIAALIIRQQQLAPNINLQQLKGQALVMRSLFELIIEMSHWGCYQGLKNGSLVFNEGSLVTDVFRARYKTINEMNVNLMSESENQSCESNFEQLPEEKIATPVKVRSFEKGESSGSSSGSSSSAIKSPELKHKASKQLPPDMFFVSAPPEKAEGMPDNNRSTAALYNMLQQCVDNKQIALVAKPKPIDNARPSFYVNLKGASKQTIELAIDLDKQLEMNDQQIHFISHVLTVYANPDNKEQASLYTIIYRFEQGQRVYQIYFDEQYRSTSIVQGKLSSQNGQNLRAFASHVINQVFSKATALASTVSNQNQAAEDRDTTDDLSLFSF